MRTHEPKNISDLKALNAATKHCCVQKVRALCLRARFPTFSLQTMPSEVLSVLAATVQAEGNHNDKASPSAHLWSCKKVAPNPNQEKAHLSALNAAIKLL